MNLRWLSISFAALGVLALACGDDPDPQGNNTGTPPDGSTYDPGTGSNGGNGYGYGSSGTSGEPPPPPVCPEELKRCSVQFTLPYNGENRVELRGDYRDGAWNRGEDMVREGNTWVANVLLAQNQTAIYKFCKNDCSAADEFFADPDPTVPRVDDNFGGFNSVRQGTTCSEDEVVCDSSACGSSQPVPEGVFDWRDSIIYFVFVDRFFNGDTSNDAPVPGVSGPLGQYQGGDWEGLRQKIQSNYFTDLGVNTLWLTVPAKNPNNAERGAGNDANMYSGYHGYWPSDLSPNSPEEHFGTAQKLKDVVAAAHAKGIKVLFDYAMVHVHDSNPVYAQHADWFWPLNDGQVNNCVCGQGCDWNAQGKRCWFADYLPHWNYNNNDARAYSTQNAIDWAKEYGIDGFRLDAIKHVTDSWLTDLRRMVDTQIVAPQGQNPERFYMVGETFTYNRDELAYYVDPATMLDGQFDFEARRNLVRNILMRQGSMSDLATFYASNDCAYPGESVMSPFLGNHDIGRVIHMAEDSPRWDDYSNGDKGDTSQGMNWANTDLPAPQSQNPYERLAVGYTVLFTQKGAPLLYYGDEIGLEGGGDPGNRKFMKWSNYTAAQQSLLDHVKKLTAIRNAHPALRRGVRSSIEAQNDVWLYRMSTEGDEVYVAVNRGDGAASTSALPSGNYQDLLDGSNVQGGSLSIPARGSRVLVRQ